MTAPDPATTAALRRALADPGSITERKRTFGLSQDSLEPLTWWQARSIELAVRPLIEAEATARERQRIRDMVAGEIVLRGGFTEAGAVLKYLADLLDGG